MGIRICCKNSPKEEELENEMKDGMIPNIDSKEEINNINSNDLRISSYSFNDNYYNLESLDTDFISSDQQKSEEIFEIFNNIRNNPQNYIMDSKNYNLYQIISSAAEKSKFIKNLIKNPFFDLFFDKCVKASPKSRKNILNNIEKEKLFNDYEKNIYIVEGNKEKTEECVWNLLKICANNGIEILEKDIDYLVISTMTLKEQNKFLCYFLFLSKMKDISKSDNI